MPYWIVHGLFHAKLPKSTSNISGTCWFILVPGISPIPCQILVSLPLVKTKPLDAVGTPRGQHETRCQRRHLENLHGAKTPRNSTQLFQLGKRTQKSGQNLVENGVQNSGKGKTTSAVVSKCVPKFWNPEKKSTTGSACNTKNSPYHPPRYSLATSWLSRGNSPYFPQWFWCSV